MIPHDRAGLSWRCHVTKSGPAEGRGRSHVSVEPGSRLYRVPLDDPGTLGAGVGDGCPKKTRRDTLSAEPAVHEEADHGSDWLIVDPGEGAVSFQAGVGFPGGD
jgi:hypothetical protein